MDEEQVLQALVQAAPDIRNGNYAYLASMVFFLYDWAISFDLEVKYFWKKKPSVGGSLYFANRFVSLLLFLLYVQATLRPLSLAETNIMCFPLLYVMATLAALSSAIVQTAFILRTYALWGCSKSILYSLVFINVGAFIAQMIIMGLNIRTRTIMVYNPLPVPYTGCVTLGADWLYQRYIPILAAELPAAALMMIKFAKYIKTGRGSRVAYVLYRDGFMEFATVTTSSIFGLMVELLQPAGGVLFTTALNLVPALAQVCCARMLLNIRDVMSLSNNPSASNWSNPVRNGSADRERQIPVSGTNGDGMGNQHYRPEYRYPDNFGAVGMESWEMHRLPKLGHSVQLHDSDEEPFEVEAEQNITRVSHGDSGGYQC